MKFTNKIPQWAITQAMIGPLEANAKQREDLIPNKLLQEALKKNDIRRTEEQHDEAFEVMSKISPSLRTLAAKTTSTKKSNINSTEAIIDSMNSKGRDFLNKSMSGTIRPIHTFDDMASEGHSRGQVRMAGRAESMFDNNNAEEIDLSQLSRASILAKSQEVLKKKAKLTSDEIKESQKGRKLGEYNPVTGMHSAAFTSAKTAFHTQEDNVDVYKIFQKATVAKNDNIKKLSSEVEKTMLDKFAESIESNNGDWREVATKKLTNRLSQATVKSKKIVDEFYDDRNKKYSEQAPNSDELAIALNQSEFSERMGLKDQEYKKATVKENKKRKEAISRNLKKEASVERSEIYKPKQNIMDSAMKAIAEQKLIESGVEEI